MAGQNETLWSGWVIAGREHRVYYSGDTGMFPGFTIIGERLGPFDAVLIETGAYDQLWSDLHIGPEQAIEARVALGSGLFIPVHWGTFNLAMHAWTEPVERVLVAADFEDVVKEKAQGHDVAISCIGIGSGTASMSEEQLMEIEVNMLCKYAKGCKAAGIELFELLTAVGVKEAYPTSKSSLGIAAMIYGSCGTCSPNTAADLSHQVLLEELPIREEPPSFPRQHFLNLRPDPQGQGAFRPGIGTARTGLATGRQMVSPIALS